MSERDISSRLIVVGADGRPASRAALRYALAEARRCGAPVRLVHVSPHYVPLPPAGPTVPPGLVATGREILHLAGTEARRVAPEVEVTTLLTSGTRSDSLVEVAADAQLLVVGHEQRSLVARIWTGSTSTGVSARARCPVVSVPAGWAPEGNRGPVVAAFQATDHSQELLEHAFRTAAERGADLVVLHAWRLPGVYADIIEDHIGTEQWRAHARTVIEPLLHDLEVAYPEVDVRVEVVHDQPAHALVQASETSDLLVLARRPVHHSAAPRVGGTARAVLREARCPVEVVPVAAALPPALPGPGLEDAAVLRT
jgi:nucleotide-binding universal stress UspA family protein